MRDLRPCSEARSWRAATAAFVCVFLLFPHVAKGRDQFTRLKPDEQIVFFPTLCQRDAGKGEWRIEIRGCIFEPEKQRLMLAALRESLELKDVMMTEAERSIFNDRARLFLVDHERGKRIFVRIGEGVFEVRKSKADGNFTGQITLADRDVGRLRESDASGNRRLHFAVELPPDDPRELGGMAVLLDEAGVSVISDIDDTIKITQVTDRRATLRNTFLRPFAPVPGMVEFYQKLARSNRAEFHYISASPWQLYAPLSEFVRSSGFPSGSFALKEFRWKNRTFLSLFADPEKYKPTVIEPLLKRFPERRFVLIGDSGERDPEIYAALARKHPRQIERILIRDVTGEPASAPRYEKAFRGLPPGLWRIFTTPGELDALFEPAARER